MAQETVLGWEIWEHKTLRGTTWGPLPPRDAIFAPLSAKLSVISRLIPEAGRLRDGQHLRHTCQRPHLQGREGRRRAWASPGPRRKCKCAGRGDRPWCVSVGQRILRHYPVHDFRPRGAAVRTKVLSNPRLVRVSSSRPPRSARQCRRRPPRSASSHQRLLVLINLQERFWRPA